MSLILKQETSGNVPIPPAGKGTLFLTANNQVAVKDAAGSTSSFVTISSGGNTQILYNDDGSLGGDSSLTFNKTTDLMTVSNLTVTGTLIAGDIAVSSIANGTSNVDIVGVSGNVTTSVAGVANVLVVTSSGANITGTLNATGNANVGNLGATGIVATTLDGSLITNAQPNITSIGTLTSLAITGNASAGNFDTGGKVIASTFESNVANGTAPIVVISTTKVTNLNADLLDGYDTATTATANTVVIRDNNSSFAANIITATLSGAATTAGTVTTAAQPNITSVGTLTSLAVTGNISAGNLSTGGGLSVTGNANVGNLGTGGLIVATGNVTGGNLTTSGVVSATGNVTGGNLTTAGVLSVTGNANVGNIGAAAGVFTTVEGTLTTNAQPNVTSVGTLTSLSVTGNLTSGNVYANSGTIGASLLTGTLTTSAQPNITSVGTLSSLSVTGNASAGNISTGGTLNVTGNSNVGNLGTGGLIVATGNITGGNLTTAGALSVTGNANIGNIGATSGIFTNVEGTLTTGSQPNITSVGTLTSVAVTGNGTFGNVYANSGTIGASLLTGTLTTNAQPNVTSVGTLTGLGVNGNLTAANITANTGIFTGNGSGLSAIAGANITGQVANALVSGTVYTAAQPNITSVGTLTSVSVTGNVAAGNLTTTGILSVTGTGTSSIAGNLDMTGNTIINLATPTNPTDAATKQYVDDFAQGLNIHDACQAATPTTLATITGGTITYNNGTAGVGANLTTTGSFNLIDGVNVQTSGTRILVKSEANTVHNGIYTWSNATVITRATDYNTVPEVEAGDFTFVTGGTLYDNTGWVQTTSPTGIGGASDFIEFTQFSGAGTYQAGTGLTLTGSQFSVNVAQPQITSVGTLTGLGVNGTITAANITANTGIFTGNGSGLSAIAGANVTGQVANALVAGTVYTAAQSNITSVGTLTGLGVNGNITAANITANTGVFTGNGSGLSAIAGGNVTGQVANALVSGTVYTAAQPNITSVGTLTSLAVTGNASAGNISTGGTLNVTGNANVGNIGGTNGVFTSVSGNGSALTALDASNISSGTLAQARLANSAVTLGSTALTLGSTVTTVAGLSSVTSTTFVGALTGAATSATTAGTVTTAAQPNITSVGTLTSLAVTGNISAGNVSATTFTGALSGAATTAGTVTTAAQPNITSVGTLTSLTLGGTLTGAVQIGTGTATHFGTTLTTGANSTAGTITGNWTLSAGSRLNATYADLAEKYTADADYEPGTVLVFGGEHEVTLSTESDSFRVAGVVTTNPAYTMNNGCEGEHVATIALQGRVPCKVIGPVFKGDLLVSTGNGYATANNIARAGTIIGKSLENFTGASGIVEVAVGRF
jgi:hypothetical protein